MKQSYTLSEKSACNAEDKRCVFDPPLGKIPCRRKQQPIPLFSPEKPHGQRNTAGYSPKGHKELHMTEQKSMPAMHIYVLCLCKVE